LESLWGLSALVLEIHAGVEGEVLRRVGRGCRHQHDGRDHDRHAQRAAGGTRHGGADEGAPRRAVYGDAKVANRDTKVWHGATEIGP
jgi:hypothetical protein